MILIRNLVNKYLRFFVYFYRHLRYRLFVALLFSILVGVLDGFGLALIIPLLQMVDGGVDPSSSDLGNLGFLLDAITSAGFELTVFSVLIAMVIFFAFKGLTKYYEIIYRVRLRFYFVKKLRFENIDALRKMSYKSFVMADSGKIQNTMSGEVGRVAQAFAKYFLTLQNLIMVGVYMGLAILANPQMAIMVAIGGAATNFLYHSIYARSKEESKRITLRNHGFQGLLIQKVANFKYLKASATIGKYAKRLKVKAVEIEESNKKVGRLGAIMESSREPLIILVVVAVIFIQIIFLDQRMGTIILSLLFLYRALTNLMFLQVQWNGFLAGSGSIVNMEEFVRELQENGETFKTDPLPSFEKNIVMSNVSFSYGDKIVLQNVNLEIKKNESVAFVGESGSGKTTLVNLLSGLMPPNSGVISIDGVDLQNVDVRTLQRRIGYITQEPVIFSDTIFNNVTFWAEPTPEVESRFWEALRRASIDTFVQGLPERENAQLGTNGILVSGGQKQRLSIARELYKNADILILDEATAALDSHTEQEIQQNIDSLKGKYTFLIVAHRLSTVKNCDKIVIMKNGMIIETGTFDELVTNSELFRKMVELQEV